MKTSKKSWLRGVLMALVLAGALCAFTLRSNDISADQKGGTMTVVRLYTGPDNKSHFEDIQIPLKDAGKVGFISERYQATGVVFRETTGQGHISRAVAGKLRKSQFITLD